MTEQPKISDIRTAAAGIIAAGVRASQADRGADREAVGGAESDALAQAKYLASIEDPAHAMTMIGVVAGSLIDRLADQAGVDPVVLLQQYALGSESAGEA